MAEATGFPMATPANQGFAAADQRRSDFVRAVYEVARKDVLQHIRTKRLLVIGIFFFVVLQLVTMVIPLAFGIADDNPPAGSPSRENEMFNFHLNASFFGGLFAIQLLCVVLTSDAVCSEWGNRTIFLLLSKPVSRTAFAVGKYVGSVASVLPLILVIYIVQYFLMMAVYAGQPTADEVVGFIEMLGLLVLGSLAITAFALFLSSLTKSTTMALILSLLSVIILLPLLTAVGDITLIVDEISREADGGDFQEPDLESWRYDWSHYFPGAALNSAPGRLFPDQDVGFGSFSGLIPQSAPQRTALAAVSALVYTGLFLGLSIWRVNKRNFE
jgi:ABC-type transport system involved in multi-copper enzyme maturation permease subunit